MPPSKPTKLVLLMSAAGFGLALPGMASASQGTPAAAVVRPSSGPDASDLRDCRIGLVTGCTEDGAITVTVLPTEKWDAAELEKVSRALAMIASAEATLAAPDMATQAAAGSVRAGASLPIGTADDGTRVLVVRPRAVSPDVAERSSADAASGRSNTAQAKFENTVRTVVAPRQNADVSAPMTELDRTLASLAEILGATLDAQPSASAEPAARMAAADTAARAPVSDAADGAAPGIAPNAGLTAAGADGHRAQREWLLKLMQANDIVVVSPSDIVLYDLAAIRFEQPATAFSHLTEDGGAAVVASEEDKVLETLAFVRNAGFDLRGEGGAAEEWGADANGRAGTAVPGGDARPTSAAPTQSAFRSVARSLLEPAAVGTAAVEPQRPADRANGGSRHGVDETSHDRHPMGAGLFAVRSDKLDEIRGGFVTDGGLKVSFGIERAVYINGDLVSTTSLNVADLSRASAAGSAPAAAAAAQAATGTLALIQSGANGNTFSSVPMGAGAVGTVIQNRLDNQQITAVTKINAAVNSASIMRSLNLQSSMRSATIDALRR